MKKAINAWTVDSTTGFELMFHHIKEAGFDGIELNLDEAGYSAHSLSLETTESELDEIRNLSMQYDLPVVSISTSLGNFSIGSPDAAEREIGKQVIRKQILCAQALGATGILTVPGGVTSQKSFINAYEASLQTLTELKSEIETARIIVGVENVWNGFFISPFDMASFIDKLNSPYISAYYDVGNVIAFSWSEYWIDVLGCRINYVHVKDYKRTISDSINSGGLFVDLLKGDVNWPEVIPALQRAGFDGYLTAEVFKEDDNKCFTSYYSEIADAIDKILSKYCEYGGE